MPELAHHVPSVLDEVTEVLSERAVELEAAEAAGFEVSSRLDAVRLVLQLLARAAPAPATDRTEWLN